MKRIFILMPSNLIGGAESNIMKVSKNLAQKGYSVDVYFLSFYEDFSGWDEIDGVNKIYIKSKRERMGLIKLFFKLIFLRNKKRYDYSITTHVHCNAFVCVLYKIRLLKIQHIIMRESTNVFSWFVGYKLLLMRTLYRFYSKHSTLVCQTAGMKSELIVNLPHFESRDIRVISNPVDMQDLEKKSSLNCNYVSKVELWGEGRAIILAVGRLVHEKAYDVLLQAMCSLPNNFALVIVGGGALDNSLHNQADNLGLSGRVLFLGQLSNPYPLMKIADIGVVSSRLEGFPNVLLEMMALAPRVVSTLCADGIDKLPGITTCLKNDPTELSKSILASYEMKDSVLNQSKKVMRDYVNSLDIEKFIKKLLS